MFLSHLQSRNAEQTLSAVRGFVSSLGPLTHQFECAFEATGDFGGKQAAYVDIFPTGADLAKDHKKFGGIFVRVWLFGEPAMFTSGIFLGAERAEQSEPRRGVAFTRRHLGHDLEAFEAAEGFSYHTWSSGNFPWATKSSRAVARQLEQFVSFRRDAANASQEVAIESHVGKALIFLDQILHLLKPIREFGKGIIQEYYSENLPNNGPDETEISASSAGETGSNVIYSGPPGTGKSTKVKNKTGAAPLFRTQFHPEYSHSDLIGSYRPVVGFEADAANNVVGHDGAIIARPVNYFAFVPGPLALAMERAFGSNDHVFLIIEEINRGDCAAIFGDAFQLLDREDTGRSEFGITPKSELLAYFKAKSVNYDIASDGKLYLPPNLTLLATMNTSDQSLYPMDSAFKRRWQWVACPIDFDQLLDYTGGVRPFLDDGKTIWDWIQILELVNKNIVRDRMEDKQLGPWFIKPGKDGLVPWDAFLNKGLFYLWHDVFKDEQLSDLSPFKTDGPEVFGEVQANIRDNGLAAGFKPELLIPISAVVGLVKAEALQPLESSQTAN
jgi:MoxR-like ATPase